MPLGREIDPQRGWRRNQRRRQIGDARWPMGQGLLRLRPGPTFAEHLRKKTKRFEIAIQIDKNFRIAGIVNVICSGFQSFWKAYGFNPTKLYQNFTVFQFSEVNLPPR